LSVLKVLGINGTIMLSKHSIVFTALPQGDADDKSKLLLELGKSKGEERPPYPKSREIFTNNNVSFLARHLLAREEWKRLAYALGFYPDDVSGFHYV